MAFLVWKDLFDSISNSVIFISGTYDKQSEQNCFF